MRNLTGVPKNPIGGCICHNREEKIGQLPLHADFQGLIMYNNALCSSPHKLHNLIYSMLGITMPSEKETVLQLIC